MLRFLRVRHLAVIDTLEVEFGPGLTVLTGETGAGKSILVDAIALLLGGRASPDLVRTGEDVARVEAIFEAPDGREVVIRREVSSQGRSRAFVDDQLVPAGVLKDLAPQLADLHGQHEQQTLLDPERHVDLLDEFAGLHAERDRLAGAFADWRDARTRLERSQMDAREKAARLDLLTFQLGEIEKASLRAGEDDALAADRRVLANADRLARLCTESYEALYEGEGAVLSRLGAVWRRLTELAALDPAFSAHLADRDELKSRLEDLAFALREYAVGIDASPERLQQVEDRLALVERLKRKYGPTLNDVLHRGATLRTELDDLQTATGRAADLQQALARAASRYLQSATSLSDRRREAAQALCHRLVLALADLAMERTRCEFRFATSEGGRPSEDEWTARGYDRAELYLSPNPGEEVRPLVRVASGGELSRIMLALKTIVSTDTRGKTLIFDEVDAGIGGKVADVVGRRLRQLAHEVQVLCITHLPQIAAHGSSHLLVTKSVRDGRTTTQVTPVGEDERIAALAAMMSATITDTVRAGARELLAASRGGESEDRPKGEGESGGGLGRRAKAKGKGSA